MPWKVVRTVWLAAVLSAAASAEPYWVAWEGNDYPENEGWTRIIEGDGPAVRALTDGVLTIDSLWSSQISDFYRIDRSVNPAAGEIFLMEWRLRVNEVIENDPRPYDPAVAVFSDDEWGLGFGFGRNGLVGIFEHELLIPYEASTFHAFQLRSTDMRTYELNMDGNSVTLGTFWEPAVTGPYVGWGDAVRGAASHVDWDYFRFGIVPEPATCTLLLALACAARGATLTRRIT